MSSVSLNAGDTSWLDSVTCDFCGLKRERKDTGAILRVQLPIADPRSAAHDAEIEYEQRAFDDSSAGWGYFGVTIGLGTERKQVDLCPTCAAVASDWFLEHLLTGEWGTHEDRKHGKEVPVLPVIRNANLYSAEITTNLSRVGELGRAVMNRRTPMQCQGPDQFAIGGQCGREALSDSIYCYEHAARNGR